MNKDKEINEIDELMSRNNEKRTIITRVKENSIKEMSKCLKNRIYSNIQIPNSWKNMVDYRDSFFKIIKKDENFSKFLKYNFKNQKKESDTGLGLPKINSRSRQSIENCNQISNRTEVRITSLDSDRKLSNFKQKGHEFLNSTKIFKNNSNSSDKFKIRSSIFNPPNNNTSHKITLY